METEAKTAPDLKPAPGAKKRSRISVGGSAARRRRVFKYEARQILFSGRHWAATVFALVLCVFFAAGARWLSSSLRSLVSELAAQRGSELPGGVFFLCGDLLLFFTAVPLLCGVFRYLSVARMGEDGLSVPEIFYYFSEGSRLLRSYALFLSVFWPVGLFAAALLGCRWLHENRAWEAALPAGFLPVYAGMLRALPYLAATLLLISLLRRSAVFYIAARHADYSVRRCIRQSFHLVAGAEGEVLGLTLSFTALFAVSACSLGVLFVLYGFPYYILTNAGLFAYLEACEKGGDA